MGVFMPLASLAVVGYVFANQNLQDIQDNWISYRCHPLVMPFAGWFKDGNGEPVDTMANFDFCLSTIVQEIISYSMEPIHYLFGLVGETLGDAHSSVDSIRSLLTRLKSSIFGFTHTAMNKVLAVLSEVGTLVTRIRDIMERMVAAGTIQANILSTFFSFLEGFFTMAINIITAVVWALFALSVILALVMPELLGFAIGLAAMLGIMYCFDEDTLVTLQDGRQVPIKHVQIGNTLTGGHSVTGVLTFTSRGVDMYRLKGVLVSGTHKVLLGRKWMLVKDHPEAEPVRDYPESRRLFCLITDSHRLEINGVTYADYEEVGGEADCAAIERIVFGDSASTLCGVSPPEDYDPGLSGSCNVALDAPYRGVLVTKKLRDVRVGDVLKYGGRVEGVVVLDGTESDWYSLHGIVASGTQLLQDCGCCKPYARLRDLPEASLQAQRRSHAYALITESGWYAVSGPNGYHWMGVRDYLDTHDMAKLEQIEDHVLNVLNEREASKMDLHAQTACATTETTTTRAR